MATQKNIIKSTYDSLPGAVKTGIIIGVTVLLVWLGIMLFKKIKDYLSKPPDARLNGDGTTAFSPDTFAASLHDDIYGGYFTRRNTNIYTQLLALSDADFVAVYNAWKNKYWSEDNETLPIAINNESAFWDLPFAQQQKDLAARFARLKLS